MYYKWDYPKIFLYSGRLPFIYRKTTSWCMELLAKILPNPWVSFISSNLPILINEQTKKKLPFPIPKIFLSTCLVEGELNNRVHLRVSNFPIEMFSYSLAKMILTYFFYLEILNTPLPNKWLTLEIQWISWVWEIKKKSNQFAPVKDPPKLIIIPNRYKKGLNMFWTILSWTSAILGYLYSL